MSQDHPKKAPIQPKMVPNVCLDLFWAFVLGCLGSPLALRRLRLCFALALSSFCRLFAFALPLICLCFAFVLPVSCFCFVIALPFLTE